MKGYDLSSDQIFQIAVEELNYDHSQLANEDGSEIPYSQVAIVPSF